MAVKTIVMLNGVKHLGCIHVDVHEILRFAQDDKCKGKQLFTINYSLFTNNMDIKLQISDSAYQRLVSSGSRIQGTIGLINPTEGNFSEHRKSGSRPGTKSIKLRHGLRACMMMRSDTDVSPQITQIKIINY